MRAGVTRRRLRAADLNAPFRGSRMIITNSIAASEFEQQHIALVDRCRGYLPVAPPIFAFSHSTAAALYRMPLPQRLAGAPLDVCVPITAQPPRRRGVAGHRADTAIRYLGGLPIVAPEVAWRQLAPLLSLDELVVVGDFLVRRKRPLSRYELLKQAVDDAAGARGSVRARAAHRDIRVGTDSRPESRVRLVLIRAGLPEPVVHHTVYDDDGFFVGTPDLAYVRERIAIEVEGAGHWSDRDTFEDDILRRELFQRSRWQVIQVTSRQLNQPALVVRRVSNALDERATEG